MTRVAECSCGQLRVTVEGDPVRASVCHCLACQRRSGSAFAVQARFAADAVTVEGPTSRFVRASDDGDARTFTFCPTCGATVFFELDMMPGFVAIPVGAFADPGFPPPAREIFEDRKHPWVHLEF